MIQCKSERELGEGLKYRKYISENYDINVIYMDEKLFRVDIICKKFMYPEIFIDIENDTYTAWLQYGQLCVSDKNRLKFLDGYNAAVQFFDNELKPFVEKLISVSK